jgi:hypothetical protein
MTVRTAKLSSGGLVSENPRKLKKVMPVGHTCVSSRHSVRRGEHIDRIIRRPLRCRGTCGLLPEGFAISREVWASLTYCAFVTLGP